MQYQQLRILCALRGKIAENDTSLSGQGSASTLEALRQVGFQINTVS